METIMDNNPKPKFDSQFDQFIQDICDQLSQKHEWSSTDVIHEFHNFLQVSFDIALNYLNSSKNS